MEFILLDTSWVKGLYDMVAWVKVLIHAWNCTFCHIWQYLPGFISMQLYAFDLDVCSIILNIHICFLSLINYAFSALLIHLYNSISYFVHLLSMHQSYCAGIGINSYTYNRISWRRIKIYVAEKTCPSNL